MEQAIAELPDVLRRCAGMISCGEKIAWGRDTALMLAAADEIERLRKIETASRNVANTLNGGFVRCETCGSQETTTDTDFAYDLYAVLGIQPEPKE